jgi:hypothetical protein
MLSELSVLQVSPNHYRIVMDWQDKFLVPTPSHELDGGRLCSLGKNETNGGAVTDFALNPGGAAVKIDN